MNWVEVYHVVKVDSHWHGTALRHVVPGVTVGSLRLSATVGGIKHIIAIDFALSIAIINTISLGLGQKCE